MQICNYTRRNSPLVSKTDWRSEKKCREKMLHQNNRQRITIASYGNRTHVNSLEGYYATTTPTMLTWTLVKIQGVTVLFCQKLIDDRRAKFRERTQHRNNYWRMTIASYGNRTHVNSLKGYYATTTPTILTSCDYSMRNSPLVSKTDWRSEKKCRGKTLHQKSRQRITIAWYGNRTHVNCLEGYYATTTPTMLTWTLVKIQGVTVLFCQKLIDDLRAKCRERTQHQNIYWRMTIASYGNRSHVNSLDGY